MRMDAELKSGVGRNISKKQNSKQHCTTNKFLKCVYIPNATRTMDLPRGCMFFSSHFHFNIYIYIYLYIYI